MELNIAKLTVETTIKKTYLSLKLCMRCNIGLNRIKKSQFIMIKSKAFKYFLNVKEFSENK